MFHVNEVERPPRGFLAFILHFFILDNFSGKIAHGRDDNDIEYDYQISFFFSVSGT